ncbi:MAG: lysophospholipid acyltransferase family protein [Flavobacteriaceae bacterium]|nr:lysophospholipid acyltransferase family protein [Flavobacteriaceae bacterium]
MTILHKILSLAWRIWFVIMAALATLFIGVLFVLPLSCFPKYFKTAYYFERLWAKMIFFGSGLRIKKAGFIEIESNHPYVVISNHTSMMDIMLMLILHPKPMVFVGKKELISLPVFGFIFKRMNITVDRKDAKSRIQVFRDAKRCISEGKSICIFPEGGVPHEDILLNDFLDGPFAIAIMNGVPLITMTICGMKEILPYAYFRGKPGKVIVSVNQVLETDRLNKTHIPEIKQTCYHLIRINLMRCLMDQGKPIPKRLRKRELND